MAQNKEPSLNKKINQIIDQTKQQSNKSQPIKSDETAQINIYPSKKTNLGKPEDIFSNQSLYLPFGVSNFNPGGFPKFFDPYGPKLNDQYYKMGGEHAMPVGFIKNYNIFTDNIRDYQTKVLPILYEDSIPLRGASHTYKTIDERKFLYEYVKANLVSYEEGEEGCMSGNNGVNLLRQLKRLSYDPVNYNILYTNPLQGLEPGIRIYRSCYPITTDRQKLTICAKGSVGLHIKFYDKNYYNNIAIINNLTQLQKFYELEKNYYIKIREEVVLKKVCPNFVLMYTYYNCNRCNEPFKELDKRKIRQPMQNQFTLNMNPQDFLKQKKKSIVDEKKCLIILTESPNQNLLQWMENTRTYAVNKRVQTQYGHHTDTEWKSFYFQLFAALYTLQCKNICINNFNYDNIMIKILDSKTGYWIYNIDGIDYYIPNCGFIVQIDCGFQYKTQKDSYHISIDDDNSSYKTNMWDKVINSDPFGIGIYNANIAPPPANILDLIHNISNSNSDLFEIEKISSKLFYTHFSDFLHNRIGSHVLQDELNSCIVDVAEYNDFNSYNIGELVIYIDELNSYKWCIYLGNINGEYSICLEKGSIKIISESDIRKTKLISIKQNLNNNYDIFVNFNESPLAIYELNCVN